MSIPPPDRSDPTASEERRIPEWIDRTGLLAWRLLGVAALIYVTAELADDLTMIVLTVAVALLLTAVFDPLVEWIDRDSWPDWIAPLACVLALLALIAGLFLLIGESIFEQSTELREQLAESVERVEEMMSIEFSLPWTRSPNGVGQAGADAAGAIQSGAEGLFAFFLTLALTFLFLKDGRKMWRWALEKFPGRIRPDVERSGVAAWGTLGGYVRGLTAVAAFDAIGVGIGLWALGVPLVLTLAAIQFVASYVPTIGAFVAGGLAAVVAFGSEGLATAGLVVVLVVVVQQLGNNVLEPWIMGRSLPLHPAVVLIAVTAGALLWGIPGALLFVPLAAAATAAVSEWRSPRGQTAAETAR